MRTSNFKVSVNVDKEGFKKLNLRPFVVGILAGAIVQIAIALGFNPQTLMSPLPKTVEAFDAVKPRLQEKVNEFKVKKQSSLIAPVNAASATEADNANAYAVVDLDTGELIAQKNSDKKLPIASITKTMTAVVALDLADPNMEITISQNAADQIPTKIGVVPGQVMTLNELLHASMMTSANDATEAIKDGIDEMYGEPVFIKAMNEKAKLLGMENTRFANVKGFDDPENYSTAEDLAILTHYSLNKYPLISEIVKKDYVLLEANENHKRFDLYNWNGLIGVYPNTYGLKIGNTDWALTTTVATSERGGKRIAAILLGAPDVLARDMWAADLLDIGFEKTIGLKPVDVTEQALRDKYGTWRI